MISFEGGIVMHPQQPIEPDKFRFAMAFAFLFLAIASFTAAFLLSYMEKQNGTMFLLMSLPYAAFAPVVLTNKRITSASLPWIGAIVKALSKFVKSKK